MAGRVILSGMVHVKHGLEYKMRHLALRCQGSVFPAKLEVFEDEHNKTKLQELSFIKLQDVFVANEGSNSEAKKLIILKMQEGEGLTFYAESEIKHNTWYIYCYVLANIPTYPIPYVSHYHIPLDSFKQEIDPKMFNAISVWRVYIINEGVGKTLKCRGFQNITINRNSTLSIVNCSSHMPLTIATWDRDKIRRSGCLDSLVFLEAGRRCQGGAGMLWMYCPQFSAHFGECLHRFLFNKTTEDDTANVQSPMYPKNFASSVDNLVDLDEGPTVTRQPATLPKSHNSDFSRHHHMCGASPARALGLVPKSHTVSMGSLILSEECSRHNEYRTSHTELSDVESLRSSLSCSNNRNVKCDTLLKPPILPRKTKKNKPPVPPRKFGPSVNYSDFSEHDTIAASTQSSATARISQDVASPINDGHQKQTKTHERVVLRHKNVKRFSGDLRAIELNTLLNCWVELSETLDITSVLPHLCSHHLLTMYDREKLSNANTTNCEKVYHLLNVLPKKDKGWLTKFLDCLCKSTEGTGHGGLATKLRVTYEEELKKYEHSTRTIAGSLNQEVLTAKPKESFPVYLELQEGSSPHVFNVTSTELVESLIERIRTELNITCPFDITLKVDSSQKKLHSRSSLAQSRVYRNSLITMVTHD